MHLRLLAALAVALIALGALAGSSSSATARPSVELFLGEWTASGDSDAALAAHGLTISKSSANVAKALVGPEWTNVSGTAYYDKYCGAVADVYAYVTIAYEWAPAASMGGCISDKTGPHIVFAGSHKEAGSVHVVTVDGLDVLKGTWDTIENGPCCVHHALTAVRSSADFTIGEQGHQALPTGQGAKFVLTKVLGAGTVNLEDYVVGTFQSSVTAATGTIHFHKWRIFEHGVVDEDLLTLKVVRSGLSVFSLHDDTTLVSVQSIGVVVTKAERGETDACPVGATGTLSMYEHQSGPNKGDDGFGLTIPKCGVKDAFTNGKKGAKVAVGLTVKHP
jgi:hypothetical protein